MIRSRTPLRVSFVGRGTDLPRCYRQYSGAVVLSAVVHYIDVTVKRLARSGLASPELMDDPHTLTQSADYLLSEEARLKSIKNPAA